MVKNGHQSCSNMFKYGENQTFYHTWLNMVFNKNIEKHDKQDQTYQNMTLSFIDTQVYDSIIET